MNKDFVLGKVTDKYMSWSRKKIRLCRDIINFRRILIENCVFKYKQVLKTADNKAKLSKKFVHHFNKIFAKEFNCTFFSLKIFLLYVESDFRSFMKKNGSASEGILDFY